MNTDRNAFFRINRVGSAILSCWIALQLLTGGWGISINGQDADKPAEDAIVEEPNEKASKYHEALLNRPSGGYLFDRFFNAWLDTGTVAGLETFLTGRSDRDGAETAEKLLLAYFFTKQNDDVRAIDVFEKVLADDPENAEAWLEKGKIEARLLNFEGALASLEKAASANSKPDIAIEIGKLKGRLLSRDGKSEKALEVWKALAAAHPDDEELQEDLVDLHLAEGLIEEAVVTMETLIDGTDDAYLKITRRLRLGDIYQRAGQREKAIAVYSTSLKAAGRNTWLEKEIIAQIEHVFRREDDLAGLKNYFAELSESETGRIALMKRHAMLLAELEDADAASEAFSEILKLTPGDRANREAFVALLSRLDRHEEAANQMRTLAELHPDDPELLAQLAVRQHTAGQKDPARESISAYLEKSDRSEYAHLRAARLLEQFEQKDAADAIYSQLVAAFPDSVSARESRAAFLHRTDRKDEANAIWKAIAAEGSGQDAIRAAKALSTRGERETAYEILKGREDEFGTNFIFLGQLCTEAMAVEKFEEALPWAEKRLGLARNPTDLNDAIRQTVSILDRLEKSDARREELANLASRTVAQSCLLAEMLERDGQYEAAENALKGSIEAGDLLALAQQVRLFRMRDQWERAAEVQRRIIDLPDGRRSANVQELVQFYGRALNFDEGLGWIEEWKKLSPGATQPWIEQSGVLQEQGKTEEAINVMRAAVQRFEDQSDLRGHLASLYLMENRLGDAERIYWTLYEESEDIAQKLSWAGSLASVAEQNNGVESLLEEFEERRRNNRTSVIPLLAIAEIHRRDGNYEGRREALLEATRLRPEDLNLLYQIARIKEEEGDWEGALDTLRAALPLDNTTKTRQRMAQLQLRYGDDEEGYRQIMELSGGSDQMDADAVLGLADSMIARSGWERAGQFLESHSDRFPEDYRVVYLRAVTLLEDGHYESARDTFLELLNWEHEVQKNPNVRQTFTAATVRNWAGTLPEGTLSLMGWQSYNSANAFRYRQSLRQGSIRFSSGFSSGSSAGGLVHLPGSLPEAHSFAKVHLLSLAQSMDEEELADLTAALTDRGVESAEILLRLPFSETFYSPRQVFPAELLDDYPDHLGLAAMAVISQQTTIQISPENIDPELMTRCYEKLKPDFPELAFAAAVYATVSGSEDGAALLRKAFKEAKPAGKVSSITSWIVSYAVGGRNFMRNSGSVVPVELRQSLIELMREWRELSLNDEKTRKRMNSLASFSNYDTFGFALRQQDDLADFGSYLDGEISRFETVRRKSGAGNQLSRAFSGGSRGKALILPLEFPPNDLPDFPPNVLIHFLSESQSGTGFPLPAEDAGKLVDAAKAPILRILFANAAEDTERTGKEIEALLAKNPESGRPDLQTHILAAAFFGSVAEEPNRAIELLQKIRLLPMAKPLRQRIDGSLVAYAHSMDDLSEDAAERLAARNAALRLRYGLLSAEHRGELVASLNDLGLTKEAERLEIKGTAVPTARSVISSVVGRNVQGLDDRVKKLVAAKKIDQARKLTLQTFRAAFKPITTGGGAARIDSELLQFARYVRGEKQLLEAIEAEISPTGDKANNADALFEYGAFHEIHGNLEGAFEYYEKGLAVLGSRKRPGIELRALAIAVMIDPEGAPDRLAKLKPSQAQQLGNMIQGVETASRYGRSSSGVEAFQSRLNQTRSFTKWVEALDEKTLINLDLAWLDYRGRNNVANQVLGNNDNYLPGLYYDLNPHKIWNRSRAATATSKKWETDRREIHDDLCRALIRSPQLARRTFAFFAGVRMTEDRENAVTDSELLKLAQTALEQTAKLKRGIQSGVSNHYTSVDKVCIATWYPEEYLIWRAAFEKDEAAAEAALALARETKQRGLIANAERFHALAFGPAEDFSAAATAVLKANNTGVRNFGSNRPQATIEQMAVPAKILAVWELRREDLPDFDLIDFSIDNAKSAQGVDAVLPMMTLESIVRENDAAEARNYLERLTAAVLGNAEKWDDFIKAPRQRVKLSGGSYTYRGGDFSKPNHQLYAELMKRACWNPDTAFLVASFLNEHELDDNGQVTEGTLLTNFDSPRLSEEPETAVKLMRSSPFFAPVESFWTIPRKSENVLAVCLEQIKKGAASRAQVRAAAREANTFGGGLVDAYLSENPRIAVAEHLGAHRKAIESKMSPKSFDDLAAFVGKFYEDGGIDYGAVSEDSQALLKKFGAARVKSQRELAEEFLAVKDLAELGIDSDTDLERKLFPMLDPLWKSHDWELAIQLFNHAIDLVRAKQKANAWPDYSPSGWNIAGDVLYDILDDPPGGGLERIAFFHRVLRTDKDGRIPIAGGGMRFNNHLRAAFDRAGGEANLEKALEAVVTEVHELCGDGNASHLGLSFMEFGINIRLPLIPRAVAWADANSEGHPWSPIAREFAMGTRMGLQTHTKKVMKTTWPKVPELETWQAFYVNHLRDESLTLPWRLALANELCDSDPYQKITPETATACAGILAEALAADAPMNVWHVMYITRQFNRLEKTPEWEKLARRLHEGWVHKNRNNHKSSSSGLAFLPLDEAVLEMLEMHLKLGDPEAVKKFRTEKNAFERIDDTARATFILVAYGDFDGARKVLDSGMEWQDIVDDYEAGSSFKARYSLQAHENLPKFLESIENPALRFFAELLLVGAPDIPAKDLPKEPGYPLRGARIDAAAQRFGTIDFGKSQHGGLLREKCIQQIAALDGPANRLRPVLEKEYGPGTADALCGLKSYKKIEHGSRPIAVLAALRLRQGDTSVVEDMIAGANRSANSTYYRREALEHFTSRLLMSLKSRAVPASPEEWSAYADAFGLLIADTDESIDRHDNMSLLVAAHLIALTKAGREDEIAEWTAKLEPEHVTRLADAVRTKGTPFWALFAQVLKTKVPNLKVRATLETREKVMSAALSSPIMNKAFGSQVDLFKPMLNQELFTAEELTGETGARLAELFPRNGWAAAELALLHEDAGDIDAAVEWCNRALAGVGDPEKAAARYCGIAARKAEILLRAKRKADAASALAEFYQTIDKKKIPANLRVRFGTLKKQTGG